VAVAEAPALEPGDWAAVREVCPVLLSRLGPPESAPGPTVLPQSAPEIVPVAPWPQGAGTAGVPVAPFSAPPSSLLSLDLPQSSWGLGLGPQAVA
jgi:hypothetical protein